MISIPKQDEISKGKQEYSFLFDIKENHNISIRLNAGTSFVFPGKLLTHRQSCNLTTQMKEETFINFVSYGTQRLVTYIKQSFMRNIN